MSRKREEKRETTLLCIRRLIESLITF